MSDKTYTKWFYNLSNKQNLHFHHENSLHTIDGVGKEEFYLLETRVSKR